jgi:hypothetical protein
MLHNRTSNEKLDLLMAVCSPIPVVGVVVNFLRRSI